MSEDGPKIASSFSVNAFLSSLGPEHGECLFDTLAAVQFFIKDRDGVYMKVNQGLLDNYLLSSPDEIVGKTDYALAPPYLADEWRHDDERVLAGASVINRMELVGRYDLTIDWCVTNKVPLRDRDGGVVGLAGLTRRYEAADPALVPVHELESAIQYIKRNLGDPIRLEDLAEVCDMSVSSFEKKFKKYFNVTSQQYVKRLRISMACRALMHTDDPISQIALKTGFCDQSHLSREFSRATGKTPKEFRDGFYNRVQHPAE